MAVRQLNFCTDWGMPLSLRGGDRIYFCHSCGHGLAELLAPAVPTGTGPIR
ncbi:MAG: hypothetical protein QOG36_1168, partial [Actinomycetota bacterium]|nr:hypothetical protein [Actinomycetota bacterium]